MATAIHSLSYNQLVETIIDNKHSLDPELVTHSLIASQFLEDNGSQLTYHGLCELNSTLKDGELAVLFRNNHFSVMLKRRNVSIKEYHRVMIFRAHQKKECKRLHNFNCKFISVGAIFAGYRPRVFEGTECGMGDIILS